MASPRQDAVAKWARALAWSGRMCRGEPGESLQWPQAPSWSAWPDPLQDGAGAEPASSLTVGDTVLSAAKESPEATFTDHRNQVARARLRCGFLEVHG